MTIETKIFDPADGFSPLNDAMVVTDCTVAKRKDRWWMYVAGQVKEKEGIISSARRCRRERRLRPPGGV